MFDTHAHYNNERFDNEYPGGVSALLEHVYSSGVSHVVNVGWDIESSRLASEMALRYPGKMYAAAGIHPCDTILCNRLDKSLDELDKLIADRKNNSIVALGEIGYDYHYDDTDKVIQRVAFDAQLSIAEKHNVPVIIHDREAHGDTLDMLRCHKNALCVMHSFSGSKELAMEALRLGCYISFSGTVSFKNAPKVREAASIVPEDRLLIETDCPYLAPHPHRGELNHSALMVHTLNALAAARNTSAEDMERITTQNALRFFGIEK